MNEYSDSLIEEPTLSIEDRYDFVTFSANLTGSNKKKTFNFILSSPLELKILENVNNISYHSKDALDEEVNIMESNNIYNILKSLPPQWATYNILSLPSKGSELKYAEQFNELISVLKNAK
jgi:hypothetical protein